MTEKSLFKLICNEDTVFQMPFEEFCNLFPQKLRSAEEVECLYNAIKERNLANLKTVKRNIKEYLHKEKENSNASKAEYVLDMLESLEHNLKKDLEVLSENEQNLENTVESYVNYLEMQADELEMQCQEETEYHDFDKRSHLDLLNLLV